MSKTLGTHPRDKALFAVHHWRRTSCSSAIEITLTLPISGLSTCNYFWKKSSSTNFLRKFFLGKFSTKNQSGVTRRSNGQTMWFEEVTWFTLLWCASILNCHTILLHHLEISPCPQRIFFTQVVSYCFGWLFPSQPKSQRCLRKRLPTLCPLRFRVFWDSSYRWVQMNSIEG